MSTTKTTLEKAEAAIDDFVDELFTVGYGDLYGGDLLVAFAREEVSVDELVKQFRRCIEIQLG